MRYTPSLVASSPCGLSAELLALTGLVTPAEAVAGFSNAAVVAVWAMFIRFDAWRQWSELETERAVQNCNKGGKCHDTVFPHAPH